MATPASTARTADPSLLDPEARAFYAQVLRTLKKTRIPFMLGGTYAVNAYVGTTRPTKDIDVFCRPGDYPRLLTAAAEAGFRTEVEDERWIGKIVRGKHYCDVIFGSANAATPVTEAWFGESRSAKVLGVAVKLLPPTELVWSKCFISDRYKFDGNDVVHILLRENASIDWQRLLRYGDQHWEVLLIHLLRFRYVYPSERSLVPMWLLKELLARLADQLMLPEPQRKACRGRIFSQADFEIDVQEWGFADLVGDDGSGPWVPGRRGVSRIGPVGARPEKDAPPPATRTPKAGTRRRKS